MTRQRQPIHGIDHVYHGERTTKTRRRDIWSTQYAFLSRTNLHPGSQFYTRAIVFRKSDNHDFGVVGVDIITIMAIVQEKNLDPVEITRSGE
jgi:hypothetical protein